MIEHVINSRVVSDILFNDDVPRDYEFRIRIPVGEEVSGVYLVSADILENGSTKHDNYIKNITDKSDYWHIENDYINVEIPDVITYEVVYIEFKPANKTEKGFVTTSKTNIKGIIENLQQYLLSPIVQNQTINQTIQTAPSSAPTATPLYAKKATFTNTRYIRKIRMKPVDLTDLNHE